MKTQSIVESLEFGSRHSQGTAKPTPHIFLSSFTASRLRKAAFAFLMACLPLSGVAYAATPAASLAQQAHRLLLNGEAEAAESTLQQVADIDRDEPSVIFEQALLDDVAGRHDKARKGYDRLQAGPLAKAVAVPSAVNLAALGQFAQAKKAFVTLAASKNAYEAGYAQLWQLWLTARTRNGNSAVHRAKLAEAASSVHAASPQQHAIAQLYAGKGSVDAVFAAIDSMNLADPLQRRNARTEAAFFAGGYLQYVRRDYPAAMRLYQQELAEPSPSIERPLIEKALATLPVAVR